MIMALYTQPTAQSSTQKPYSEAPKMVQGLSFYVLNAAKSQILDTLNHEQLHGIHMRFWLGPQTNEPKRWENLKLRNLIS
jgi:hypothetical protein